MCAGLSLPALAQSPNSDTYFYTPGGGGVNGALGMCLNGSSKAVPCNAAGVLPSPMSGASPQFPSGSTVVTASAIGTTAATTATLAAAAGKTTYLCGFSIRANATAAATGNASVTGTVTGTLNFTQWTAALASGIGITEPPIGAGCIPASAANTGIAVISAAPGVGGTVSVSAWGYQL
jgi:hypothetical protein